MLITRLWKNQPGKYFCLSTKSAAKTWKDHFFARTELRSVDDFIERNKDKDIYFCPHGFNEPRRKKECAVLPQLLWADLDEIDPRKCKWRPTIAIESSPGRYVGLWSIDRTCKESVNQRMTYALGADRGGWDVTQVLRVPGTTNYKYHSTPRVRVLWSDGPTYSLHDIEKELPAEQKRDDTDAREVYEKYEADFSPWIRRELLNGKPKVGKRSEMLWKLVNSLIEAGVSREDCFTLLRASPWNKFEGNDAQLEREIEKASGKKFKAAPTNGSNHLADYHFLARSLDDVEEENINWIWYPYLARGELTILEGDPDVGKSYLAQMVSGYIVDGKRLPSEKRLPPTRGAVAYFDMENSAGSVTKKRVVTNEFRNIKDFYQEEEPFTIDDDKAVDQVFEAIEHLKPVLVVFDTLNTYIGKADIYRSNESQQAFALFRDIARRYNCAVVVLRHLTKGSRDRALYRGQGSIAFAGLARVIITVGTMPDDPETKVMAVTKLNITRKPRSLTFTITALPDTLKERDRSKFEWGDFVDMTSDELLAAPVATKTNERDEAKEWLKEALAGGPADVKDLERMAESRSISWRTVQRAATELGVIKRQTGFGRHKSSEWKLDAKKERARSASNAPASTASQSRSRRSRREERQAPV